MTQTKQKEGKGMSDYKPITGELREWAEQRKSFHLFDMQLKAIADRIDAEHERVCYDYQREFEDWKFVHDTDFVELPKDANGETIRLGDDMETMLIGHDGEHSRVDWISLTAEGWEVDGEPPTSMRHYHAPTVDDVLRELVDDVRRCCDTEQTIAEYASKLQLAGEDK